ncbi:zinc-binding dehydrogenase [Gordonia sputi]
MRALISDDAGSVTIGYVEEPTHGQRQALIEVQAISINRGETFLLEAPAPRWRPGKDIAGVVIESAADGSGPAAGTRVVAHVGEAGWADLVAVDTDRMVALPDGVSVEVAAALPLAGLTALRLGRAAGLAPGTSLLVTGASGGVGHYLAEIAAGCGALMTAVVASTARGGRLREFGATTLLDLEDARSGFDVGLDSVGGNSLGKLRRRVAPEGRVIWFGQASREPATLDFFDWVNGTVGAPVISFDYTASDRPIGRDLATLVGLVGGGRLHPVLDEVRTIADAAESIAALRERRIVGNLVLKWG